MAVESNILILERIRENLRTRKARKDKYPRIIFMVITPHALIYLACSLTPRVLNASLSLTCNGNVHQFPIRTGLHGGAAEQRSNIRCLIGLKSWCKIERPKLSESLGLSERETLMLITPRYRSRADPIGWLEMHGPAVLLKPPNSC